MSNHLMHPRVAHNHADNGYFPTDAATLNGINARLDIGGNQLRLFDPCCGGGNALAAVAMHLTECGSQCHTFGVELDRARAHAAGGLIDNVVRADIESCILQPKTVGLLFLNPPYGFGNRDQLSGSRNKRLEETFFERTIPVLQDNGILVLIVPIQSLTDAFTRDIASRFTQVRMFKAGVDTYKQVVILAVKPRVRAGISKAQIKQQQQCLLDVDAAVPISDAEVDFWYEVPPLPAKVFRPINHAVDAEGLQSELADTQKQTLWPNFGHWFGEGLLPEKRRPLCALGQWHAALALAAGQVSGIVTDGRGRRLLIKGSTHKTKVTTVEEQSDHDGNAVVVTTALDRFVPSIRAIDLTPGSAGFGDVLTIK
ncbi:DUF6094 domain-containing protein [Paralysiella testudinis]|uniref:DNA methylase n=1 Tax=Paralysiella testudinis TaxID=2809020 RepID=A0A892ZIC0_9NEIS|nr:DUF6094 domain-containing protein [Paralysiella testudinis]QRQ81476.1 DNA methylase [Paralysiella testudinis]